MCSGPWGHEESDTTERLNDDEPFETFCIFEATLSPTSHSVELSNMLVFLIALLHIEFTFLVWEGEMEIYNLLPHKILNKMGNRL